MNVRTYPNSNLYVLYEIWDTDQDWKEYVLEIFKKIKFKSLLHS